MSVAVEEAMGSYARLVDRHFAGLNDLRTLAFCMDRTDAQTASNLNPLNVIIGDIVEYEHLSSHDVSVR